MPTYLLAILVTDLFLANKDKMDQVIATRIESGLNVEAYKYLALIEKREKSITAAHKAMKPFDAIVSPTTTIQPPLVTDAEDPVKGLSLALGMTQNTQPANYLDLCAVSLPIPCNDLPIGYQLNAGPNNDSNLLNLAVAIENLFEQKPDLLKT